MIVVLVVCVIVFVVAVLGLVVVFGPRYSTLKFFSKIGSVISKPFNRPNNFRASQQLCIAFTPPQYN